MSEVGTKQGMDWLRQAAAVLCQECGRNWRVQGHMYGCVQFAMTGLQLKMSASDLDVPWGGPSVGYSDDSEADPGHTDCAVPVLREAVLALVIALERSRGNNDFALSIRERALRVGASDLVAAAWVAVLDALEGGKGHD